MRHRSTSPTRRCVLALATLALAFVLSGCYRSDLGVTVEDDGSGKVDFTFAIDPEQLASLSEQLGEDASGLGDDPCSAIGEQSADMSTLPEGTEVEPYEEDGFCGVHITTPFEAGTDIGAFVLGDLEFSASEDSPTSFESFVIERDGDGWRFEATTAAPSDTGGFDSGLLSGFLGDASNIVRVKLPGEVVEEDADRVDDGALVWDLDPLGESRTLSARTEPDGDGGGSNLLWIILGAVAVAAVVVVVALWLRNRNRTPPAAPGGTPMSATPPTAPPVADAPPMADAPPVADAAAPQWDAERGAYIQWDAAGGRWMQYDQGAGEWRPLT
jgi:hypothetical protein